MSSIARPIRFLSVASVGLMLAAAPSLARAQTPSEDPNPESAASTAIQTSQNDQAVTRDSASREGFLPEPRILTKWIRFGNRTAGDGGRLNNGFYAETSNMITGAGWISLGPGYRHWLFDDRAIVEGSAAVSWRGYKMAQTSFEFPNLMRSRLAIGTQAKWMDATQITYFGNGADSLDENRSEYRMKTTDIVGHVTVRPRQWLAIGERIGWLRRPGILSPAGNFKRGNPSTQEIFPDDLTFTLDQQPNYLHGDAFVIADTRDSRSHATRGGVYRAAFSAYSDRDSSSFSFNRYEAEAAQFVPVADNRVVLALHGWFVATQTDADQTIPFYLMPALGGHNTLRAYTDYRFHDRNMFVINAESRFALFTHVDLAAFVDAGNVAAKVSNLDLDKRAYGLGLRMHSGRSTFARFDVAHGTDGWRFLFRTSDPLHLNRLSRRTAATPFVP